MSGVPVEVAFEVACKELGHAIVMQRLLQAELGRVTALLPAETSPPPTSPDMITQNMLNATD